MTPEATKRALEEALEPYQAPGWLSNPHLQTFWGPLFRKSLEAAPFSHERLHTPDDDLLDLYTAPGQPEKPVALLVHGLEGSWKSTYLQGLYQQIQALGWTVCFFFFRTCNGENNRAKRMYHSGETADLDFVVGEVLARFPQKSLYLAAVSLGGNVTAKWLAERGDEAPKQLKAAAIISAPYDLTRCGPHIDAILGGFYVKRFLKTLKPKAAAKAQQYPGCMDIEKVLASRSFEEYDTHATAALHGFRDAWDYWERCSSLPLLHQIRRPTLLLSALDDPFIPGDSLPHREAQESAYLLPMFPSTGGHVGFVHGSPWRPRYWAEEQSARFLAHAHRLNEARSPHSR